MAPERILSNRKRHLFRSHIPGGEIAASLFVLLGLAAMGFWLMAQQDNYNPGDRDLPYDVLAKQPVEDRLYQNPLQPWAPAGPGGANTAGSPDLGLFPTDILKDGWAISSRPRRFNKDTLFQKINGEAEKFIRLGFQELHYIAIKKGKNGAEISMELFDQGDFSGALGIFSSHRSEQNRVERQGTALFYTTPIGAIGFQGRYFFRLVGSDASPPINLKTRQLVKILAGLNSGKEKPPAGFAFLTGPLGIDPGRIAYQSKNVFQYDFAEDFWFGQVNGNQSTRFFMHKAANPRIARGLFLQIGKEHKESYQILQRTDSQMMMRHRFLKTFFALGIQANTLYGVEKSPTEKSLGPLMARFLKALGDEK